MSKPLETEFTRTPGSPLLESKRDEIGVRDLDLATFIIYGIVEALTHAAVLTRPDLLGPAFVREVTAVVVRYLRGGGA